MKIQLDTTARTIKLESSMKLGEFVKIVKKLLPDGEWEKFSLETNTVIERWSSPIIIKEYPYHYPWWGTGTVYVSNKSTADYKVTNSTSTLKSGVYNIEA